MKRLLFPVLLLLSLPLYAQDRPKFGVVLSGGGAKGAAHIGVLKAMEEAGLRPDFIAGTSMGSMVGGLYAIGFSADEIEQILLNIDWNLVLSNQVPLNCISFEEKEYYNRYLVEFPIEGYHLKLPSGLYARPNRHKAPGGSIRFGTAFYGTSFAIRAAFGRRFQSLCDHRRQTTIARTPAKQRLPLPNHGRSGGAGRYFGRCANG
ncbi:MAG: patatin-like phospholipase family protein [Flavobacteriales bacterium]|nr:patatin-like phospholipase family protein [Flavobacteriales bacterium]